MEPETSAPPARDWSANLSLRLFRYRALVKRRWWVLALTVGIGLAYALWASFQKPVEYISRGELSVSETIDVSGPATIHGDQDEGNFYGTNLLMIQNQEVQDRALRKVTIDSPKLTGKIEDLTATRSPGTSIFSIAAIGTNPAYTQAFVNAIMAEFINYKQEKRNNVADRAARQIGDETTKQRLELEARENDLRKYADQNDMSAWAEQGKEAATFLSDLSKKRARMETDLDRMQNLTSEQLLNMPAAGDDTSAADSKGASPVESPIAMDLATQYLQKALELSRARAKFAEQSKVWKPKHPRLIAIRDTIAALNGEIEDIKAQNAAQTKVQIGAIKAELVSLEENIKNWEVKARDASHKNDAYQQRVDAVTRAQNLYTQLLSDLKSVKDIKTMGGDETIQTLQDASPPEEVSRGIVVHLATGLIAGLVCGSLFLLLLDRADDRLSSSTEVMDRFSEPIIGQIPNVSSSRTQDGLPLLGSEDSRYTFAESFRSLRSSLIFMPNQGELRTLIVTSAIPGEGKSTVASNLAITMALAGARVLLVDADLRRGDLTGLFGLEGRVGLSSVLRGEASAKDAMQKTKYSTLTLLPSGPVTNQSSELLLKPAFPLLLVECRDQFDLTIFNTSPILATDDTATIAPSFDGTLMVVRAQFTSARLVASSLNALYQRQVNVLGLILNCVDTEMPDYYYYRYPKYYAA